MRRGQVALYLLMTIVVLAIVAFMNVDIFLAVRAKNRVQNAGDAATLAAARVQGELLNRIGRLNVEHIFAALDSPLDGPRCRAIETEQRRLALLGPVEALRKANEAAKANGAEAREDFTKILRDHVVTVRTVYSGGVDSNGDPYPEPWENAWAEYAAAIENAIAGGLACGPDNSEYYDALGGHLLLNPSFYSAVAGRCWCWFRFHARSELENYGGWHTWGALPARRTNSEENSEFFSLHVRARTGALTDVLTHEEIAAIASEWGGREVRLEEVQAAAELTNAAAVWFHFEEDAWSQWFDGLRLAGEEDDYEFPLVGEVKAPYNVCGAAAVCRCIMKSPGVTDDAETEITWSAAAKPFGKIADETEGDQPVTFRAHLVLPAFEAVRLVPIDAVPGADLATADAEWVNHVRKHLPDYLEHGPRGGSCYYCRQLVAWENRSFHAIGTLWLKVNEKTCRRGTGGGGGHGGTRRGH